MNGNIELITGTLGGGKTSLAVEEAFNHLCRGGWVFSNIEWYPDAVRQRMAERGLEFDPQRLVFLEGDVKEYQTKCARGTEKSLVMVVIDEAGLEVNSRDWAKTGKDFLAWNTMARKLDIRLLYISQDANDIDKQVRKKADTIWVCRNMKKLKIWGVLPFPLPFYFRVRFDNTRGSKPVKLDSEVVLKSPAWGLYNSNAMVGNVSEYLKGMKTVEASPLNRIPKAKKQVRDPNGANLFYLAALASSCASSFYFFSQ